MSDELLSAALIARLVRRDPPTAEQVAIIEADLTPALVVAGAGSGKTETMAARVVWLLANGLVAPGQVLGLTFTRKAAGELELRVRRRLRALVRAAGEQGLALPGAAGLGPSGDTDPLGRLERPVVSTYNAYAGSLVLDHALRLGLEPGARLLAEAARWQLAGEVVESWADDLGLDNAVSTVVDAVLALAGKLDEHLLDPDAARAGIRAIVEQIEATPEPGPRARFADIVASLRARMRLLDVVAEFRARKRTADAIDFGDQVALAARLALEVPEVGAVERDRFRVVLLDEYQDTSYAQLELLRALFGGGHPVTAVGDPHQSIYGWRGASAGGLERFPEDFVVPAAGGTTQPARVLTLATSFRNDRSVLAAANVVAEPLRRRSAQRGGPVEVPMLAAGPKARDGSVQARVLETVADEAEAVADFVAEHWRGRDGAAAGGRPGAADGVPVTAAVLCRKRRQFELLGTALRARGLPVEVVGLGGLLDAPEVVDLVALLRAAHDPSRGDALMRLLTGARYRIGAADLLALAAWARHLAGRPDAGDVVVTPDVVDERSIVDAVDELPLPGWRSGDGRSLTASARERLVDLAGVLRAVRRQTYLPLVELVGHAERLLGLDVEVLARPGADPARARAHLDAFAQVADDFARAADSPTLGAFLAWLEAAAAEEDGLELPVVDPDPYAVQLMTIHAAKGLEWDVVAVPGLVDGVLPSEPCRTDGYVSNAWLTRLEELPYPLRGDRRDLPDLVVAGASDFRELERRRLAFRAAAGEHELAEERRLAYVAVTRARHRALLAAYRWDASAKPRTASPFLLELAAAGIVTTDGWEPVPAPEAPNPYEGRETSAIWPVDPLPTPRRGALERAAVAVWAAWPAAGADQTGDAEGPWDALADRLLAERAAAAEPPGPVELPAALSASAVVRLDRDPEAFATALRRPVPQPPSPQARLGTAFHAWVEGYFGAATLVDVDALPGADDDSLPAAVDLDRLRERFRSTPWAGRRPLAVEVEVHTSIDGYVVNSRIDAVFEDVDRAEGPDVPDVPDAVVVVDWKTGRPPQDPAERAARELQLAVYRLAWSRWKELPLEKVRAAFCYVATGETVYPERLLDEAGIAALLRTVTGEEVRT
ncbi:MAG TPA: ATP-dependent DNA helicase [Cellulomonas sp.]